MSTGAGSNLSAPTPEEDDFDPRREASEEEARDLAIIRKLADGLAEHAAVHYSGGDGHESPREAWVTCSCGAQIWEWQQYYNENPTDPDDAFRQHLAYIVIFELGFVHREAVGL